MGDVVRLVDAIEHIHAAGSLRAANVMLDIAETTDDRAMSRRSIQKARYALAIVDRFMSKAASGDSRCSRLHASREKLCRRLEAVERTGHVGPDNKAHRPTCVLLDWPHGRKGRSR